MTRLSKHNYTSLLDIIPGNQRNLKFSIGYEILRGTDAMTIVYLIAKYC